MTFEQFCIGFVITILSLVATGVFGTLIGFMSDIDMEYRFGIPWLISAILFGICLTVLLYMKGVIV